MEWCLDKKKSGINYLNICESIIKDEKLFRNFKNNKKYTTVLEHLSKEKAFKFYNKIDKSIINEDIFINDTIGNPKIENFDNYKISSSTVRYIYVLYMIKSLFNNIDGWDIIEVGGGYGGQCLTLSTMFNFNCYDLIDQEGPSKLTEKYLNNFDIKNFNIKATKNKYDLFISNYAFSEFDKNLQKYYYDKYIKNSKHIFMIINSPIIDKFGDCKKIELKDINKEVYILYK